MGATRLASDGTADAKIIGDTIKKLQERNEQLQKDNAKATKNYLIISIIATFVSTISGIAIGKYLLI